MTFQFSDGWWKYLQDSNLDVHDTQPPGLMVDIARIILRARII